MGASLNGDKGNITFAFALNDRSSSDRVDRPWFRDVMKDPTIGGDEFFPDFSGYDSVGTNYPSQATIDSIFNQAAPGAVPAATRFYFNPNGTAVTGFFQSFAPAGAYRFTEDLTGTKWKKTTDGNLNFVHSYQNDVASDAIKRARTLPDPARRKELYATAQKELVAGVPFVWLYVGRDYVAFQNTTKGFVHLPTGSVVYLRQTWLDK